MIRYLIGCAALALLSVTCNTSDNEVDCSVMNHKGVELIYPRGTETFTVGSTVPIKWKVDGEKVDQVRLTISTVSPDGPFSNLFEMGIMVDFNKGIQCMDTVWNIGNESGYTINYAPPQTVYLRVEKYKDRDEYYDVSGTITINNP